MAANEGGCPTGRGRVRVAICQILCVTGDREGNFERIEDALAEAAGEGAQIACFPETMILGWVNPDAHREACPIPGADTERLGALARLHDIMVCIGLAEKDGDRLYDVSVLIDRSGRLLHKHRKLNLLTNLMDPPYTPGDAIVATETEFGRVGMLICADTFLARNLEAMRDERPDLVLAPFGWAARPEAWPEHGDSLRAMIVKAARSIGAPIVGVDLIGTIGHGPWKGRTFGGQSVASTADGTILARCRDRERDVVVVDVPLGWTAGPGQ
jgi:predicted amidohydrolase